MLNPKGRGYHQGYLHPKTKSLNTKRDRWTNRQTKKLIVRLDLGVKTLFRFLTNKKLTNRKINNPTSPLLIRGIYNLTFGGFCNQNLCDILLTNF